MNGKMSCVTIIMNDLSVMGGAFKSKFKHVIRSDGAISYSEYNAVGKQIEKKELQKSVQDVQAFFTALADEVQLFGWNNRYYSDACGGFRWEVDVEFEDGEHFNPHGYIKLPPRWEKFAILVNQLTEIPLYVLGK